MALPMTPSGGMIWHPYINPTRYRFMKAIGMKNPDAGRWVHNPYQVGYRGVKALGLAGTIAEGNFHTRTYRQKYIPTGLEVSTHKRTVKPSNSKIIDIPSVANRRVKKIIPKNKILTKIRAMPYRKTYRKTYRRKGKKGTRSHRRRYRSKRISKPIPQSKLLKLKMSFSLAGLGSANGLITVSTLKANSFNDPGGTFSQKLPYTIDQMSYLYNKYIVLGSKLTAKFIRTAGTGATVAGLHLADNTTALANHDAYRDAPHTVSCVLTDQQPMKTIAIKYSGKKFWRVNNLKDDSEQEGTLVGAGSVGNVQPTDPTDVCHIHVFNQDLGSTDATTVEAQFTLEWIALLTDPVTPATSTL